MRRDWHHDVRAALIGTVWGIQMKLEVSTAVNIKGPTAIPKLIERHGHYTSFGGSLTILDFRRAQSFADIVSQVAGAVNETEPGEWIIGRGWHQDKWEIKEEALD